MADKFYDGRSYSRRFGDGYGLGSVVTNSIPQVRSEDEKSFSYEKDITPLKRQYFDIARNTGLPASTQAQLVRGSIAQMQQEEAKDLELQQRAVTFESTKMQLEKARQEYADQQQGMASLGRLKKELEFAVTGVPESERRQVISLIGMNNADVISRNPIAKSMFDAAGKSSSSRSGSSQQTLIKGLMDDLDKVKFAKDYADKPTDQFEDAGSEGIVSTFIDVLGTPEIQQQAANATAKQKLDIARKMRSEYYKSQLIGGQQRSQAPSPRSLYAPQGAPSQ
jgi:hypothetical protein